MFLCKLFSLQESGQLDQRTSTAVESLLSLSNPSASEEMQWRPPSPASSISTESATFSPSRPDSVESAGADGLEIDHCDSPPATTDVPQSPGAMVSALFASSLRSKAMFLPKALFTCSMHARKYSNVQNTLARHADTPTNYLSAASHYSLFRSFS